MVFLGIVMLPFYYGSKVKILVIASEPISADRLRAAFAGTPDDAEILVGATAGI